MSHKKDTDYLAISTRVHAMENRMLSRERMDRMIDAKDDGEALKVLSECGYGGEGLTLSNVEAALAAAGQETFRDLLSSVPDPKVVQVFQLRYDYHNAKALVKAQAVGKDARHLLMSGGRYAPQKLAECFDLHPQLSDLVLDRACYQEMAQLAKETGSRFLEGYVALSVDVANLRAAVRVARMGKGSEFLTQVLLPGGNVSPRTLASARGEDLAALFQAGALSQAAQLGAAAAQDRGHSLTAFERECDNALKHYVDGARRVPFGEQAVIGYLYAKEAELTAIRTILASRRAGLDGAAIRERLRETYV